MAAIEGSGSAGVHCIYIYTTQAGPGDLEGGICGNGGTPSIETGPVRHTPDTPSGSNEGERKKSKGTRVANILQWVECFHAYMGVVIQQQPSRALDLLAYASLVVHAARKYKGEGWST